MTRKDYDLLVRVFGQALVESPTPLHSETIMTFAAKLCGALREDNPRFRADLFKQAIDQEWERLIPIP